MKAFVSSMLNSLDLEEAAKNSYKDYHCKGMDYLCLQRSKALTIKLYIIDGLMGRQLVCPHDHLYDFQEYVLQGGVKNHVYEESNDGLRYGRYLVKNKVFTRAGDVSLRLATSIIYEDDPLIQEADVIHTLEPTNSKLVILAFQHQRKRDYSLAYSQGAPSVEGLYNPCTIGYVYKMVERVRECVG